MTTKRITTTLLFTSLLFFIPACSDDDPTDPGDGNGGTVTDPVGETLQAEAIGLSQAIVEMVPALASGQLGGKVSVDPWFDETCTCWRWSETDNEYTDTHYWESNTEFAVTFYAGETPQMQFEGSDLTAVDVSHCYYESSNDEKSMPTNDKYYTKSVTYNMTGEVTEASPGVAQVSGSGSGLMSGGTTVGEEWEGYSEEFTISLLLTQPIVGCPTGGLDFDVEAVSFSVGFQGSSTATWAYSVGPGDPTTGTFPIPCGSR